MLKSPHLRIFIIITEPLASLLNVRGFYHLVGFENGVAIRHIHVIRLNSCSGWRARSVFESSVSLCIPMLSFFQTHPRSHSFVGKAASVYPWVGRASGKSPALSPAELGWGCWQILLKSVGLLTLRGAVVWCVQTCFGERVELTQYP